jgi:hypothetical protein
VKVCGSNNITTFELGGVGEESTDEETSSRNWDEGVNRGVLREESWGPEIYIMLEPGPGDGMCLHGMNKGSLPILFRQSC